MFRKHISKNCPALENFPLVKGQNVYPYRLSTIQSRVWSLISKKLGIKTYSDKNSSMLIYLIKPFILDVINSNNVKQCEYYNAQKLQKLSDSIKKDELTQSEIHELDWWLAFELFRQQTLQ